MSDSCLVTIAMALYHPNLKWLQEELVSIEKQTFRQFQLYVWNDDPNDSYPYESFFEQSLKHTPFKIFRGTNNLGSNKVFEKLTT